jgi:hypothetical protein
VKNRQGAEIPDELVFKEVAQVNHMASVSIITVREMDALLNRGEYDRRKRSVWWRKLFDRRSACTAQ